MARLDKRRSENIEGNFYIDNTCIDCDTCRWMSPAVFTRKNEQSAVYHQPSTEIEEIRALQALLSCPTASIGTMQPPSNIKTIQKSFPISLEDNVYHCGYHAQKSFGAASYFIQTKEGNILIDSPKFSKPLVQRLEEMGGIKYLYLTHKDDVADHQKYHDHFKCDRLLHLDDITEKTKDVEIKLENSEPLEFIKDFLIIPVPGHTKGHCIFLYQNKFLFTGDHLCWSDNKNQLIGFKDFCWYSWEKQIESMEKLVAYNFNWILPGHGRRYYGETEMMQTQLEKCILWMKTL